MPEIGWKDLLRGENAVKAVALAGGVALHAINVYVAATILPSVVNEIGGLEYYAWNTTLFVVASIVGAASSAKIVDRLMPRNAYLLAATVFAGGVLICALSPTMPVLLAGRFVQGLGGGMLFALSYMMVNLFFPESLWTRAMALVSGMWGVATLVGPSIGGVFAELNIWRWAFASLLPLTLLLAVLITQIFSRIKMTAKSSENDGSRTLPFFRLLLLATAVLSISVGSLSAQVIYNFIGLTVALFLMLGLILLEIKGQAKKRLLPHNSFNIFSPLGQLYATMALLVLGTTPDVFVPYFLQNIYQFTPLYAGYAAALVAAGWTLGSLLNPGGTKQKQRRLIVSSPVIVCAGLVGATILFGDTGGSTIKTALICFCLTVVGYGVGQAWSHLLSGVLAAVSSSESNLAASSITTVQLLATAFGAAFGGMVANLAGMSDPGGVDGTANAAFWLFAVFSIFPIVAILTAGLAVKQNASLTTKILQTDINF